MKLNAIKPALAQALARAFIAFFHIFVKVRIFFLHNEKGA